MQSGGSARRVLVAIATLTVLAASSATSGVAPAGAAGKKCVKEIVGGKQACLKQGQRCKAAFQEDYLRAGFSCRKRKLRPASTEELRGPQPLLIEPDGTLSLETALAAFDQTIADLPGVDPAPGEVGELLEATSVVSRIGVDVAKLTPEQQSVFLAFTTPAPDAAINPVSGARGAGRAVDPAEQARTLGYVDDARKALVARGYSLPKPISLSFLDDQAGHAANVAAYVTHDDLPPKSSPACNMFITPFGRAQAEPFKRTIIAHEVVHCAQHAFFSSADAFDDLPMWVMEGSAEWLGNEIGTAGGGTIHEPAWINWLRVPNLVDLFERSYDAVGFYAMLAQAGIDPNARIKSILAAGSSNASAFAAATAGAPKIFFDRWGPGFVRTPSLGAEWDLTGTGIPASSAISGAIKDGDSKAVVTPPRSGVGLNIQLQTDVFVLRTTKQTKGLMRSSDGKTHKFKSGAWCAKTGAACKCKTGRKVELPEISRGVYLGFGDVKAKRYAIFEGMSIGDYCKGKAPKPAKPGTCAVPGPGIPARQGGGDCDEEDTGPKPAGISIYDENQNLLATFKSGNCTAGNSFVGVASDGAWELEVGDRRLRRVRPDLPADLRPTRPPGGNQRPGRSIRQPIVGSWTRSRGGHLPGPERGSRARHARRSQRRRERRRGRRRRHGVPLPGRLARPSVRWTRRGGHIKLRTGRADEQRMAGSGVAGDARGRTRSAVAAFAVGVAIWAFGFAAWALGGAGEAGLVPALCWLVAAALTGVAIALLPGAPRYASGLLRTLVDGLIVAASALFLAWTVGLDDLFAGGAGETIDVAAALMQVTVGASAVVMLTRARSEARPVLAPLALGLSILALASCALAYLGLGGESATATTFVLTAPLGLAAIAVGLRRASSAEADALEPGLPTRASVFVPSVPFAIAVVAAAVAGVQGDFEGFLIANGAAVIVLIVLRQVLALWENISFWRRLEAEVESRAEDLRQNEARFRSLVQNSSDVITVLNADMSIAYQSPSTRQVFGYAPEDIVDIDDPFDLVHGDDVASLRAALRELTGRSGASIEVECRIRHADGEWRHVESTVTNLIDEEAVGGFVVNARDITERKELEQQLIYRAFHDPLTTLANRALFGDRLRHALSRRTSRGRSIAILFCDLDEFKRVNDSLGHGPGDRMLTAVGSRIGECVRAGDTVARLGGDEFAVLLEEPEDDLEPVRVAERILDALTPPFELEGRKVYIQVSIGIATTPDAGEKADDLLRAADVAMYTAKGRGGGAYELFESSMHTAVIERLELETDLRHAIERGELVLDYQPIVALESGEVRGAEALLRWDHPQLGRLPPGRFIEMAEATNLIGPIGRWVLNEACAQGRRWHDEFPDGSPLAVSVNLSPIQLQAPGLVEEVEVALMETGIAPETLTLEITESAVLETETAISRLGALRDLGVRIAVDDFGTGLLLARLPAEAAGRRAQDRPHVHRRPRPGRRRGCDRRRDPGDEQDARDRRRRRGRRGGRARPGPGPEGLPARAGLLLRPAHRALANHRSARLANDNFHRVVVAMGTH